MKIQRYTAESMRAALAQVRAEQGPDAVILSSRRIEDGIEVIAAVDYDEGLFAAATRQRTPDPIAPPPPAPAIVVAPAAASPPAAPARSVPRAAAAAAPATQSPLSAMPGKAPAPELRPHFGYGEMQRELRDLRQLLETGLAGMTWNDKRLRDPEQARVLEELSALDIAPDVAMALAALAPRCTSVDNPSHVPMALLVRHLPVLNDLSSVSGGVVAVVGPTGAGKTTTIAKLAARWCLQHGSQDLALVSTDAYRIGARDQLMTYARILGTPMHAANSGKDLARVLERLQSKKLILIDTAGMGPRDVRLAEQLAALQSGAARARVLLALPAQGEGHALEEIVKAFAPLKPLACILTKVDEAVSLGAVISTTLRHRLKIAYVCDGQRVPDDLHAARDKRIWLVSTAEQLKIHIPPRDQAQHARNFGRVPAHA
ncbi:MAG TPA: flagellar biosynthesis protein FlhF [Steroidobacteraceae bacterium]|nr:flagellar biosynthesis protein FlhF [Steroidobacteraceae bacterium]